LLLLLLAVVVVVVRTGLWCLQAAAGCLDAAGVRCEGAHVPLWVPTSNKGLVR
jgi:hypothetical protein